MSESKELAVLRRVEEIEFHAEFEQVLSGLREADTTVTIADGLGTRQRVGSDEAINRRHLVGKLSIQ